MKIYLLGLLLVAVNVIVAAPSDKDKDKGREIQDGTKKSQLDMLSAQMQRLQDQVEDQQRLRKREQDLYDEELQLQLQEQQEQIKELRQQQWQEIQELRQQQQQKNDKQQEQIKELTRVNRVRRYDNDTVEHLKELIRAEIAGLSQCEVGDIGGATIAKDSDKTYTIPFGRNFTRTPKVILAMSYHWDGGYNPPDNWGFKTKAQSITTTKFDMYFHNFGFKTHYFNVGWIACD